jgi:hypothetical protein
MVLGIAYLKEAYGFGHAPFPSQSYFFPMLMIPEYPNISSFQVTFGKAGTGATVEDTATHQPPDGAHWCPMLRGRLP